MTMERTNARSLRPEMFADVMDMAVMDLSFISVRLVLPAVRELLTEAGEALCLIKPQFEAGREDVGKKGVVRDASVHERVLREFLEAAPELGYTVMGLDYSPVRGPEGNIEYLAYLKKGAHEAPILDAAAVVAASHRELAK